MEMVQEALLSLLTTVMIVILGIAGTYFTIYCKKIVENAKANTEKIQNEDLRNMTNNAIDRLSALIITNVIKAQETSVKEILAGVEDGTFDRSDLKSVAVAVKNDVLNQRGDEIKELVSLQINDIDGYIEAVIEVTLAELKGQI